MAAIRYHWHCIKTVLQLAHQLREKRFDVAVDFGGHIYTLMVMACCQNPCSDRRPKGGRKVPPHPSGDPPMTKNMKLNGAWRLCPFWA